MLATATFCIGVALAALWLNHRPSVLTLGLPPCASPPDYELVSVPCTNPDLSSLNSLPVLQYCQLVSNEALYRNHVIRVKGIYSVGMENSSIYDPQCRIEDSTWVESEPYSGFDEVLKDSEIERDDRAEVVFLGKFYGPSANGYGHLNGYRYKLAVMKVEEFRRLPKDRSIRRLLRQAVQPEVAISCNPAILWKSLVMVQLSAQPQRTLRLLRLRSAPKLRHRVETNSFSYVLTA